MKTYNSKSMGCYKSNSKREIYRDLSLSQEIRKTSNKQPTIIPKAARERRTTTTKKNQR